MLSIELDSSSAIPASIQLEQQIVAHIVAGTLAPGVKLPSVRQLAADLDIAPGTVAKAYSSLEAGGMVTTSRSKGTRVAPGKAAPDAVTRAALAYIRQAKAAGATVGQARSVVENLWNEGQEG